MNYAEICIIKRDGKREDFSISKIKNAISKAYSDRHSDRKSTRLNSSHSGESRMPSSA